LIDLHHKLGARLVEFAGWEMPILYTSIGDEHRQTRASGSLFDVSHMGRIWFTGDDVVAFLERLCTRRVHDMAVGQCRYSLVCNEEGGVRDDVLLYRLDEARFMLVVNAANREKLLEHFGSVQGNLRLSWEDRTQATCMVAVQGPRAMDIVATACPEATSLKRYRFIHHDIANVSALVSRTGYTGEDGVEAIFPAENAEETLTALLDHVDLRAPGAPIKGCGLGARDTLRLEAGMPLYGHELGEHIPAYFCGIDFAINLDKAEAGPGEACIGHDALSTQKRDGVATKIVGLRLSGKRTARQGMAVLEESRRVGEIASACVAPTVGGPIATAFVESSLADQLGAVVNIDAGGRMLSSEIVRLPFYKRS